MEASIPAAINAGGEGLIAAGLGGVWLSVDQGRRLIRINPGANAIVASAPLPPASFGVATGFGSVWVTNSEAGTITRLGPQSLHADATIRTGPRPLFLAIGWGSMWVVNQGDGSLSRIDPKRNRVVSILHLDIAGDGGCIATDDEAVWITVPGTPLVRVDMSTNRPTHRFTGPGGDCLSVGYGSLWLSNHEFGSVWRVRLQA